jgi:hypothetical protein
MFPSPTHQQNSFHFQGIGYRESYRKVSHDFDGFLNSATRWDQGASIDACVVKVEKKESGINRYQVYTNTDAINEIENSTPHLHRRAVSAVLETKDEVKHWIDTYEKGEFNP